MRFDSLRRLIRTKQKTASKSEKPMREKLVGTGFSAFANLSIKVRIFSGFGLILLLILLAGGGGILSTRSIVSDIRNSADVVALLSELQDFSTATGKLAEKPTTEGLERNLTKLGNLKNTITATTGGAIRDRALGLITTVKTTAQDWVKGAEDYNTQRAVATEALTSLISFLKDLDDQVHNGTAEAGRAMDRAVREQTKAKDALLDVNKAMRAAHRLEQALSTARRTPDANSLESLHAMDNLFTKTLKPLRKLRLGDVTASLSPLVKELSATTKDFLSTQDPAQGRKAEDLTRDFLALSEKIHTTQEKQVAATKGPVIEALKMRAKIKKIASRSGMLHIEMTRLVNSFMAWINAPEQPNDALVESLRVLAEVAAFVPEEMTVKLNTTLAAFTQSQQSITSVLNNAQTAHDKMIAAAADLSGLVNQIGRQSLSSARASGEETFVVTLIGIAVVTAVCLLVFLYAGTLLRTLTAGISRMARGQMDAEGQSANLARRDELGELARAIRSFADKESERERLAQQRAAEQAARTARAERIEALISAFRDRAQDLLSQVSQETGQMEKTAADMSSLAVAVRDQTGAAGTASTTAAQSVAAVATATEQLSASISEITRQVRQATGIVNQTSATTVTTRAGIDQLAKAAQKIGDVMGLIRDISEQTNLLALNATIEAARAGDAGKGFAVVASEVKSLATQTGKATEDIAAQIAAIQAETNEAVTAVQSIVGAMAEVNTATAAIASSVEQQAGATTEISSHVHKASDNTGSASDSMGAVSESVEQTARASERVQNSATQVAKRTDDLRETVTTFLAKVTED